MTSDERALKQLIGQRSPSHLEFVAARDRVIHELRATPAERLTSRISATAAPPARWRSGLALAAAAAVILAVATVPWTGDDVVRAGDAGRMLTLDDGSQVEMGAQTELSIERAADGIGIRLLAGDIIVNAAKQRGGHLYVHTKDMTVAVVGTVFLVNAGPDGSRVAVIEGEVQVQDGKVETTLWPGEQMSSRPTLAAQVRPVIEEIAWSRRKDAYLALLRSAVAAAPANQQVSTPPASGAAPTTRFDEASIRPCSQENDPGSGTGRGGGSSIFQMTPGRYYARCVTVAWMIYSAYPPEATDTTQARPDGAVAGLGDGALAPVVDNRVKGGPRWVYEDRYTVEAVADPDTSARTLQKAMMWDLLERRMQVKVHPETEQVPAFELVLAPAGLKVKPMADGDTCATDPSRSRLPGNGNRNPSDQARCPTIWKTGWVDGGPNYRWEVSIGMGMFVRLIRNTLGDPVFGPQLNNKTGIPGDYMLNFAIEFGPDATNPVLLDECTRRREIVPRCGDQPTAAPMATVLERELGLRFQPTTRPREFVVIDAIERPAPN
jgi:uncharacterized protein (TIGR03435 family)